MTIVADKPTAINACEVTLGVDTHADTHVAGVIDPLGRHLGQASFETTLAGFKALLAWATTFGVIALAGVEGTGAYGAGLARFLTAAGFTVVEVDRRRRRLTTQGGHRWPRRSTSCRSINAIWSAASPKPSNESSRVCSEARPSNAFITDSLEQLLPTAKITAFMPVLTERFTRDRLRALAKVENLIPSTVPSVLFLCVHNAGRSQMAAGWMRKLAGDTVIVYSGGSEPASEINPAVTTAMAEVGIDISDEFPKPWTDETVRAADVVITMGCGDACPLYPGKRYEDWELDDPADATIDQVRPIRDAIRQQVEQLLATVQAPRA